MHKSLRFPVHPGRGREKGRGTSSRYSTCSCRQSVILQFSRSLLFIPCGRKKRGAGGRKKCTEALSRPCVFPPRLSDIDSPSSVQIKGKSHGWRHSVNRPIPWGELEPRSHCTGGGGGGAGWNGRRVKLGCTSKRGRRGRDVGPAPFFSRRNCKRRGWHGREGWMPLQQAPWRWSPIQSVEIDNQ